MPDQCLLHLHLLWPSYILALEATVTYLPRGPLQKRTAAPVQMCELGLSGLVAGLVSTDTVGTCPSLAGQYCPGPCPRTVFLTGPVTSMTLQYFCLENPMDGEAWWAAVYGVARVGPCVVWKGFPAFPAHLRMRPSSRGNSRPATWVVTHAERPRFPGPLFIS